jgi:hypothetical protein
MIGWWTAKQTSHVMSCMYVDEDARRKPQAVVAHAWLSWREVASRSQSHSRKDRRHCRSQEGRARGLVVLLVLVRVLTAS